MESGNILYGDCFVHSLLTGSRALCQGFGV